MNVSSISAGSRLDWDNLNQEKGFSSHSAYSQVYRASHGLALLLADDSCEGTICALSASISTFDDIRTYKCDCIVSSPVKVTETRFIHVMLAKYTSIRLLHTHMNQTFAAELGLVFVLVTRVCCNASVWGTYPWTATLIASRIRHAPTSALCGRQYHSYCWHYYHTNQPYAIAVPCHFADCVLSSPYDMAAMIGLLFALCRASWQSKCSPWKWSSG